MSRLLAGPRAFGLPMVAAVLLASCGEDIVLPPATSPVTEQQILLHALTGTSVQSPSAYNMLILLEVRTDQTSDFDFAFELGIDSVLGVGTAGDTVAVLLPRGALGFAADGGLQATAVPFDSIVQAPLEGYEQQKPTRIRTGDAVLAISRLQQCNFNIIRPLVAKLRIDTIDLIARTVSIRVVIDPNCGYLSLAPGIPQN